MKHVHSAQKQVNPAETVRVFLTQTGAQSSLQQVLKSHEIKIKPKK